MPLELPVSSVARIDWVVVRDTFGVGVVAGTAATQAANAAGRQFRPGSTGVDTADNPILFLPGSCGVDAPWRLASPAPEVWIPFVAVNVATPEAPELRLRRAALLDTIEPAQRPAKGQLLAKVVELYEEEVGRAGLDLTPPRPGGPLDRRLARDLAGAREAARARRGRVAPLL